MHVVTAAQRGDLREKATRMNEHARGSLNQRLDHEGRDLVGPRSQFGVEKLDRSRAIGARRRRDGDAAHEQWTEDAMKQLDATDADRAERVAVIRVAET